jgi:hypothetical protein
MVKLPIPGQASPQKRDLKYLLLFNFFTASRWYDDQDRLKLQVTLAFPWPILAGRIYLEIIKKAQNRLVSLAF